MAFFRLFIFVLALSLIASPSEARSALKIGQIEKTALAELGEAIITQAYDEIGLKTRFIELPSRRSMHMADQGRLDAEMLRTKRVGELFPNLVRIDVPVIFNGVYVITCHETIQIKKWDDLAGFETGVLKGLLSLEKRMEKYGARQFSSLEDAFRMLRQSNLDYVVVPIVHLNNALLKTELPKDYLIADQPLINTPLYHYINVKHIELKPLLEDTLRKMHENSDIKHHVERIFDQQETALIKGIYQFPLEQSLR